MRNLKRALSLALASVMVLGLMIVGSSAAGKDFTDYGEIEYKEAVDVMTAIDIIDGMDDGSSFNPDGILNREQAAKIIATMVLGRVNADNLKTTESVFTDVAPGSWAAGYISFCHTMGYLTGDGAGHFYPSQELTGVAFGKLLLCALGYDPIIEGYQNNPTWETNIASDMVGAGIAVDGLTFTAPLTREQATQMAFQTLTADMVDYQSKGMNITSSDGTVVAVGATPAKSIERVESGATNYAGAGTPTRPGEDYLQFCERYFPDLKLNGGENDDFMRDGDNWTFKSKYVTFKADKADYTWVVDVAGKTIQDFAKVTQKKSAWTFASEASNRISYINGEQAPATTGLVTAYNLKVGSTVEYYLSTTTANQVDKVIITEPAVYTLTGDAETKVDGDVTEVKVPGVAGLGGFTSANTIDNVIGYSGLKKDDVVLVTKANGGDKDGDGKVDIVIQKAESITGKATGKKDGSKIVVDGAAYNESGLPNKTYAASSFSNYDDEYTFYLDPAGAIVKAEKITDTASNNFAFVLESSWVTGGGDLNTSNVAQARLLLTDGTVQIATVSKIDGKKTVQSSAGSGQVVYTDANDSFVTYKVADGKYELTKKAGTDLTSGTITQGKADFSTGFVGNNSTIFLVNKGTNADPEITVYTGIKEVPGVTSAGTSGSGTKSVAYVDDGITKYVYVYAKGATVSSSGGEYIYIPGTGDGDHPTGESYTLVPATSDDDEYYIYNAYVNGVEQEIKLSARTAIVDTNGTKGGEGNVAVNTLYKVAEKNSDGVITELDGAEDAASELKVNTGVKYSDGTLTAGTTSYRLPDDAEVYMIYWDNSIAKIAPSAIQDDATDKVFVVKDSDSIKQADIVYIVEDVVNTIRVTGYKYTLNGVEQTPVTSKSLETGNTDTVKSLTGKGGQTVEITDVTCAGEGTWAVNGTCTVKASGESDTTSQITITVTAEDGTTTGTVTIGFQVDP